MATLYVENVPDELYEALRERAKQKRRSSAAEELTMLEENVLTARELKSRREFARRMKLLRATPSAAAGPFPSTEEMQRSDRSR